MLLIYSMQWETGEVYNYMQDGEDHEKYKIVYDFNPKH